MEHVLDNPAWNALNTGNKNLALGNPLAKYYPAEISPFAGLKDGDFDSLPAGRTYAVFAAEVPENWTVLNSLPVYQMVFEGSVTNEEHRLRRLTDEHIPAMLELTRLTNPGPFLQRTIDFGLYHGIFDGTQLAAMAGQRMQPLPYVEISAVCTHPDHLGKGYASKLLKHQLQLITHAGHIPFLHVMVGNPAINVYKKLGFVVRAELVIKVIKR